MQAETVRTDTRFLDHLLKGLALALVLAVVGFGIYYYADRRASAVRAGPRADHS